MDPKESGRAGGKGMAAAEATGMAFAMVVICGADMGASAGATGAACANWTGGTSGAGRAPGSRPMAIGRRTGMAGIRSSSSISSSASAVDGCVAEAGRGAAGLGSSDHEKREATVLVFSSRAGFSSVSATMTGAPCGVPSSVAGLPSSRKVAIKIWSSEPPRPAGFT